MYLQFFDGNSKTFISISLVNIIGWSIRRRHNINTLILNFYALQFENNHFLLQLEMNLLKFTFKDIQKRFQNFIFRYSSQ